MRNAFIKAVGELAEHDSRTVLLTGDLGYTVLEPFADRFPDRYFNVGVAEQNMVGVATGLAEAGFVPFVYSIATFATMRPYEFIRNGPAMHELPMRIVGVGGGFDYGENGITHYALEDVGIMRLQPNVTVVAPAEPAQAEAAVFATSELTNPVYFRIGKTSGSVPGVDGRFELGRAIAIGEGHDLALVAIGTAAAEAVHAAELLAEEQIDATVVVVPTLNPSPDEDLAEVLGHVPLALTVEAHYVAGGIGSLVSEIVAERGLECRVIRCGVRAMSEGSGSSPYLHEANGLSPMFLTRTALNALTLEGR